MYYILYACFPKINISIELWKKKMTKWSNFQKRNHHEQYEDELSIHRPAHHAGKNFVYFYLLQSKQVKVFIGWTLGTLVSYVDFIPMKNVHHIFDSVTMLSAIPKLQALLELSPQFSVLYSIWKPRNFTPLAESGSIEWNLELNTPIRVYVM